MELGSRQNMTGMETERAGGKCTANAVRRMLLRIKRYHTLENRWTKQLLKHTFEPEISAWAKLGPNTQLWSVILNGNSTWQTVQKMTLLSDQDIAFAEKYLVRVWAGARSTTAAETFDQLRVEIIGVPVLQ